MAKKKKKKKKDRVSVVGDVNGDVFGGDKIEKYELEYERDEKHGCLLWLERGVVFVFASVVAGIVLGAIGYVIAGAILGEDSGQIGAIIGALFGLVFAFVGVSYISRYRE